MDINLVSITDFRKNQKKYFELAKNQRVVITQRGTSEIFELVKLDRLNEQKEERAITGEELLARLIPRVEKLFK